MQKKNQKIEPKIELSQISQLFGNKNENDVIKSLKEIISKHQEISSSKIKTTPVTEFFRTPFGTICQGDSYSLMKNKLENESVDLIMTSPPFGLVRKKEYGNEDAENYLPWFQNFATEFYRILKNNGSLVIDIGGAWNKGMPTRNLYHFELLIMLCKEIGFHLVQEFYWWNPAKLPTPAEWVNIRRIRVKDAINCVWWLSKTPYPKASNKRVLQSYSRSMISLLENGYNAKMRPSGHDISTKFQKNNKGAIPPNLLAIANTESNSVYQRFCRTNDFTEHPARFPIKLPAFFIRMLTEREDLVFDPFAGSCVTGEASEALKRNWICCELDTEYLRGAVGRFADIQSSLESIESTDIIYEIAAPQLKAIAEENSPLPIDGGEKRPNKENQ